MSPTTYTVVAVNFWPTTATISAHAVCATGPGIQATGLAGNKAEMTTTLLSLRESLVR